MTKVSHFTHRVFGQSCYPITTPGTSDTLAERYPMYYASFDSRSIAWFSTLLVLTNESEKQVLMMSMHVCAFHAMEEELVWTILWWTIVHGNKIHFIMVLYKLLLQWGSFHEGALTWVALCGARFSELHLWQRCGAVAEIICVNRCHF